MKMITGSILVLSATVALGLAYWVNPVLDLQMISSSFASVGFYLLSISMYLVGLILILWGILRKE